MSRNAAERAALALAGLMLLASALITGRLAFEHMQLAGSLCGSGAAPHCGWCVATVALAVLAAFSAAAALAPVRTPESVRA